MSQILLITSSPRAAASYSTQVAHALAKNLIARRKDSTLVVRDLAVEPLQHIDDKVLPDVRLVAHEDCACSNFARQSERGLLEIALEFRSPMEVRPVRNVDEPCLGGRDTLQIPSIKVGSETGYRFIGVFHALNQRLAQLCR